VEEIQGFTHFLTSNQPFISKHWQTPSFGRQTMPTVRQAVPLFPACRQAG